MNAWDVKQETAIPLWQARIKECRSSGMTVKEWCASKGIKRSTYYKWEALCIAWATQRTTSNAGVIGEERSIIQINPALLPSSMEPSTTPISAASAELVIRCGCVSMDISPQMPVARIAELVSALNRHV